ncbi:uncharacterized protein LOC115727703 isoform X2 [Rhodamnia argentea]|uniref:Uncharacterized protein LOC115727703 isoform X2 n=1 Tax=Rhodamnia argentea TaxID=178133 RepID=A0A8B8MUX3_9MYRT|nr:uncharacterized protein LOC115727703 isoform X2 [Rhodamnia argentea]
MQSPFLHLCRTFSSTRTLLNPPPPPPLGFRHSLSAHNRSLLPPPPSLPLGSPRPGPVRPRSGQGRRGGGGGGSKQRVSVRGKKDNVWSIDNDVARAASEKERTRPRASRKRGRRVVRGKRERDGKVMVSGAMLMEVETVLQTQEPVIRPVWNTFASSVSGIWKGVGAVFSTITAEMEPIEIGKKNENLYDCYTLSCVQAIPASHGELTSQIQRKINWVTLNPYGEISLNNGSNAKRKEWTKDGDSCKDRIDESAADRMLPKFDSFNFEDSDLMEEDVMGYEPGLVFFEDGSYSRGPIAIPVSEVDDSNYYLSPTLKFEQCLVKGCHKRLRSVHTIQFNNGGADIQIMRVAVYEEEWVSPANIRDESMDFDVKPFSLRKRTQPSDLTGSWKVFEVSATPVYAEETVAEESNATPYVYLCTETLKKRTMPENLVYFGEEEMLDMQDATILWLPGGVTSYVDINKDGILCIGVGWYSDEGINLVMERDYGLDGKLKEVRWKSEVKRRWSNPM